MLGGLLWLLFKNKVREQLYHLTGTGLRPIQWHLANTNNLVGLLSAFETRRQLSTLVLDQSAPENKQKNSQSEYCLNLEPESHT